MDALTRSHINLKRNTPWWPDICASLQSLAISPVHICILHWWPWHGSDGLMWSPSSGAFSWDWTLSFCWFHCGCYVSVVGVSPMDETMLLRGQLFGGCALVCKNSLKCSLKLAETQSNQTTWLCSNIIVQCLHAMWFCIYFSWLSSV